MEERKIVKSGNTSYILALPINWIRKNNLNRGMQVQVYENELGDLVIATKRALTAPKEAIVTIKVDGKDFDGICLEFLIAYIHDASSIIFEGKDITKTSGKLLDFVKFFIGLDVIEQSTKIIVVKNFFSLDKETSPGVIIKKMDMINRAEFEMLQHFFHKGFAKEDFSELQRLNDQNERLFNLARKSTLKLFEYPQLMKNVQTDALQLVKDKMLAQALRTISVGLLNSGNSFLFLDNSRSEIKPLKEFFEKAYSDYQDLFNAVYNKSGDRIKSFIKKHFGDMEDLDKLLKTLEDPLMIQVTNSLHIIRYNLEIIAQEALM
ncbi:hypothetical protein HZC30_00655 [Candidatus Woesearchaeota archaeon]|nr:hypothetical protein [Candidatus Woesearchaeota archaeon]